MTTPMRPTPIYERRSVVRLMGLLRLSGPGWLPCPRHQRPVDSVLRQWRHRRQSCGCASALRVFWADVLALGLVALVLAQRWL